MTPFHIGTILRVKGVVDYFNTTGHGLVLLYSASGKLDLMALQRPQTSRLLRNDACRTALETLCSFIYPRKPQESLRNSHPFPDWGVGLGLHEGQANFIFFVRKCLLSLVEAKPNRQRHYAYAIAAPAPGRRTYTYCSSHDFDIQIYKKSQCLE